MASALKAEVSVLPKNRNRQRQIRAMSGKTAALCAIFRRHGRLTARFGHLSNLRQLRFHTAENKRHRDVSVVTLAQCTAWRKSLWEDAAQHPRVRTRGSKHSKIFGTRPFDL